MPKKSNLGFKYILLRKSLHFIFTLILILPVQPFIPFNNLFMIPREIFYTLLSVFAVTLNVIQLKRPLIRSDVKKALQNGRKMLFNEMSRLLPLEGAPQFLDDLDKALQRFEDMIDLQLSRVERKYEQIGGYIGITYGVIGSTIAYFLFENYVYYGVLSLMFVDSVSAIVGSYIGFHHYPLSEKTVEGSLFSFFVFFIVLSLHEISWVYAIFISLVAIITEVVSPEDNFYLPIIISMTTDFLNLSIP